MKYELMEIAEKLDFIYVELMFTESMLSVWRKRYAAKYGSVPNGAVSNRSDEIDGEEMLILEYNRYDGERAIYNIYKEKGSDTENEVAICINGILKFFPKVPRYLYFTPTCAL